MSQSCRFLISDIDFIVSLSIVFGEGGFWNSSIRYILLKVLERYIESCYKQLIRQLSEFNQTGGTGQWLVFFRSSITIPFQFESNFYLNNDF